MELVIPRGGQHQRSSHQAIPEKSTSRKVNGGNCLTNKTASRTGFSKLTEKFIRVREIPYTYALFSLRSKSLFLPNDRVLPIFPSFFAGGSLQVRELQKDRGAAAPHSK